MYVAKENHSLEGVQRAFDAILENIDEHLKHSEESLSAFRGMVINAINQRINQLKSTAQITAGLTFKHKRRPNAPDLTVLPVRKQIRPGHSISRSPPSSNSISPRKSTSTF